MVTFIFAFFRILFFRVTGEMSKTFGLTYFLVITQEPQDIKEILIKYLDFLTHLHNIRIF